MSSSKTRAAWEHELGIDITDEGWKGAIDPYKLFLHPTWTHTV